MKDVLVNRFYLAFSKSLVVTSRVLVFLIEDAFPGNQTLWGYNQTLFTNIERGQSSISFLQYFNKCGK